MENQDNEQYSTPQNKPKPTQPDPHLPGDEREKNIRSGAANSDQLDKLQPKDEDGKAANQLGTPPSTDVNQGN